LFVAWLSLPATAAQGSAQPALTVRPASGPVGTAVTITLSRADCGVIVFEESSANGGPAVDLGTSTTEQVLIPSFVGDSPTQPVTPGRYQFAVSCSTGSGLADFTNFVAAFRVTSPAIDPGRFVGMARTPDGGGYWLVQAGGGVYSFGDAKFHGSLPGLSILPAAPIVGISSTPDGGGYWLVGADLSSYPFGDAPDCNLPVFPGLSAPVYPAGYVNGAFPNVGAAANAGAVGFEQVDTTGSVIALPAAGSVCVPTAFPSADYFSLDLQGLHAQISGIATSGAHAGPWLVGIDGGVFAPTGTSDPSNASIPASPFFGSLPSIGVSPAAPIVGITATPDGGGYWLLGADGGLFAFGDARFYGSAAP